MTENYVQVRVQLWTVIFKLKACQVKTSFMAMAGVENICDHKHKKRIIIKYAKFSVSLK